MSNSHETSGRVRDVNFRKCDRNTEWRSRDVTVSFKWLALFIVATVWCVAFQPDCNGHRNSSRLTGSDTAFPETSTEVDGKVTTLGAKMQGVPTA